MKNKIYIQYNDLVNYLMDNYQLYASQQLKDYQWINFYVKTGDTYYKVIMNGEIVYEGTSVIEAIKTYNYLLDCN